MRDNKNKKAMKEAAEVALYVIKRIDGTVYETQMFMHGVNVALNIMAGLLYKGGSKSEALSNARKYLLENEVFTKRKGYYSNHYKGVDDAPKTENTVGE
jgi:hypothetical protein